MSLNLHCKNFSSFNFFQLQGKCRISGEYYKYVSFVYFLCHLHKNYTTDISCVLLYKTQFVLPLQSDVLRYATVPIVSEAECKKANWKADEQVRRFWANSDNLLYIEAKTLRLTCLDIGGDDLRWRHRKIHMPGSISSLLCCTVK